MTNIIQQIETNSLNNNKVIKENSLEIIKLVTVYGNKKTDLKSEDFRKWVLTNKIGKQFSFLFDEKGKKDKLVMSQHSRNINNGLMAIYKTEIVEETFLFQEWAIDDDYKKGNNVSSFTKMSANLTAYNKFKNPTDDDKKDDKDIASDDDKKDDDKNIASDTLPSNDKLKVLFELFDLEFLTNDMRDILEKVIKSKMTETKIAVNQ
tara:strand:+ start:1331 stop:1948 length:618 start_codon:yes stop_codon:yes gene_type:complete